MRDLFRVLAVAATAVLSTACAGLEMSGPSELSGAASLLGTWNSTSSVGAGASSCTNFQWQLTGQQGNTVAGEASAICGPVTVSGTVSGTINGKDVQFQIDGSADGSGVSCPFSITGTARIEGDAIRVPYSGSTCLGPANGEEVLRRPPQRTPAPAPAPAPAPDPAPTPPPPSAPSESPFHVGPGPQAGWRAEQVVRATADEFAHLLAPRATDAEAVAQSQELLRRMIWHLQHAGFQAGRQRNPSGAVSNDKLTVFADNAWHAFDVFYDYGVAGKQTQVIFYEVFPPNTQADGGIPD